MGIRDKVQAKVGAAFDAKLADAVSSFTGSRTVTGSYDPTTGQTSTTATTYTGRGVFSGYSVQEADGQHILATDTKLTALQNEVTLDSDGSQATPQEGDTIEGLEVVRVQKDPAAATWKLTLRKT